MGWTESAERRSRKNDFGYWLSWAAREIGICRAVKVHGWLDALPPTFTRGVPKVAHTGGGGSTNFRKQSVKQHYLSVFAVLILRAFL